MYKVDAVVVGAGVVGLAIARSLAMRGRDVLVLERESGIGQVTSSRNSEVIHAGLYYKPESLKARFCVDGRRALYRYCAERAIPHRRCGKLVVATAPEEDEAVLSLYTRACANGVEEIELIGASRLKALQPTLRGRSALVSATTGIVDAHALMLAFQGDAENAGAQVLCRTPLIGGTLGASSIVLRTGGDAPAALEARLVVNAAGLGAWDVSGGLEDLDLATIPPRHLTKGSYFSMRGGAPFHRLIYPVPMEGGLGIHLTFDLGGQVRFGPDAEWVDTIDYRVDPVRGEAFYDAIRRYWPELADGALAPDYAGIRPRVRGRGEPVGDFVIQGPPETGHQGYIALYGIESPGLTSSLAIGDHVADMLEARAGPGNLHRTISGVSA